jgi:hypothetical protein
MTDPNDFEYEAPEADAAEQAVDVDPDDDEEGIDAGPVSQSLEAPEWDAQEQSRTVQIDDDYR